ncbi:MAG TPA: VOC family protein [Burkholderiales bacterium]|nr:VOC family protein [Burkholderiales bacterium]
MTSAILGAAPMVVILPVKELERARAFYVERLGFEAEGLAADGKFVLRAAGAKLALMPKPGGTKAEHTALSFKVEDLAGAIKALKARGVGFHDYDLPGFKTVNHVAEMGSEKAAWFSDTEGNILCLHEDVK